VVTLQGWHQLREHQQTTLLSFALFVMCSCNPFRLCGVDNSAVDRLLCSAEGKVVHTSHFVGMSERIEFGLLKSAQNSAPKKKIKKNKTKAAPNLSLAERIRHREVTAISNLRNFPMHRRLTSAPRSLCGPLTQAGCGVVVLALRPVPGSHPTP